MSEEMVKGGEILLYQNGAEKEVVNVVFHDENFWLTQRVWQNFSVSKCLPSAST